jgi:fimbrial chaperone protein
MKKFFPVLIKLVAPIALAFAVSCPAHAGLFGISPIRVDLDRENKTGSITVSNDDPQASLQMQAKLMEWTQDASGQDIYTPSNDLVFFPQIFTVNKQEQRVVRVGYKVPAGVREKSYRLFVEELPPPRNPDLPGAAQVLFVLRFGIPIFLRPEQEQVSASIEGAAASDGKVAVTVRNNGNGNFQIQSLTVNAANSYSKDLVGGYVLAGATKVMEFEMPADTCKKSPKLEISMKTDHLGVIARTLDLDTARCGAK